MERLTIGALVTIDVHARDVVTLLVELGIDSKLDFDWLSQLRYALEDGNVIKNQIAIFTNNFFYLQLNDSYKIQV